MNEGRMIAIGDVHGCSAALAALSRAIEPTALDTLVFLGDYIDRGPDSRGVPEQVIALAERCTLVPLLGNHEEMLLAALEGQSELRYWLKFGGTEALASYGCKGGPELRPADLRALILTGRSSFHQGLPGLLRDGAAHLRPRLLRTQQTAARAALGRPAVGFSAARPGTPLLRQGGHRGAHAAEERRGSGPRLLEVHRHLLPRRGLAHSLGGQDRQGLAGEHGGGNAERVKGAFNPA
jgi:hypothetical protein